MQEPSWLEETAFLLLKRASDIKLHTISKECHVSISWLSKLQKGKLIDPSVTKLQTVNEWLKAQKHNNV